MAIDYKLLYANETNWPDTAIKSQMREHRSHLENNMRDPLYLSNTLLNSNITINEVRWAVRRAKLGKACGMDRIPNEVLKQPLVVELLHYVYMFCFDTGLVLDSVTYFNRLKQIHNFLIC